LAYLEPRFIHLKVISKLILIKCLTKSSATGENKTISAIARNQSACNQSKVI
jgi:hypothetical protein